jgi:hypothetical protein
MRPKLRALDIRPLEQNGQRLLLLRDPAQISDAMLGIPQALAPVLLLCDGQWDAESSAIILAEQFHIRFEDGVLEGMIEALDEALFLDNARFAQAKQRALDEYRAAPFRPPMLAAAEQRWAEAIVHFQTATKVQARMGKLWDRAQTLRQLAEAHLSRGGPSDLRRARELLHEVQTEFEALNVSKYVAVVHKRMATLHT